MPSFQRILGLTVVVVSFAGLAHGRQRQEAAPARQAPSGVPPTSQALTQATSHQPSQVVRPLGNLPLRFEANQGQTDERVEFLSRGQGYTLFLTGEEAVLSLRGQESVRQLTDRSQESGAGRQNGNGESENSKLETRNWKFEIRNSKIQNPKSRILQPPPPSP